MMMTVYRIASVAAYPLLRLWLRRRAALGKEDPTRLRERLGHLSITRPDGTLVWIHAASVGEANSVLPLIEQLHNADSRLHIVLTTGTVTSARLISKRLPARAYHHYLPLDVPFVIDRFLNKLQPDIAIWVESEFWPNLLGRTHARGVPMLLVNARLSERSMRRWRLLRGSFLAMMRCFTRIYAGSLVDKQRLHQLGVAEVQFVGNIKYDATTLSADPQATSTLLPRIADRRVWLAASTHPGEEEIIAAVHRQVREVFPDLLTIIVPRHPHRAETIGDMLAGEKLILAKRSKAQPILPETDIYLADTLGELGLFYRLAGVVFMGGSLVPHGGHNPIEPAQLDCALLCGTHMHNFANIVAELKSAHALLQVTDAAQLTQEITELLRDHDRQEALALRAHKAVDHHRGASDRIATRALQMLGIASDATPEEMQS